MYKKSLAVLIVVVIMGMLTAGTAWADGGLFGRNGNDIYEPEQKAVIFFHDGTEEMVLSVRFEGAAGEFAWLVPTPTEPEIEESNILLFEMMSTFMPPDLSMIDESRWGEVLNGLEVTAGVSVMNEMTLGPFDLTVVSSDDAADLRVWLNDRGFALDPGAESVLAGYIDAGWCFTAMRINPSYLEGQGWTGSDYQLSDGTITPLRFTFRTEQPVFPLAISSVNPGPTEVLLYVLAGEPCVNDVMLLENEQWWQPEQVAMLSGFSALAPELEKDGGCYVTKQRETFTPGNMEDLYFTGEVVDKPSTSYETWPGMGALDVSMKGDAGGTGITENKASFPWWVLLIAALILAAVIAALYGSSDPEKKAGLKKRAILFLAVGTAIFVALLPLGLLMMNAENCQTVVAQHVQPSGGDILLERDGWSVLLHPDGRSELLGLGENLARELAAMESETDMGGYVEGYGYASGIHDGMLFNASGETESEWEWGIGQHPDSEKYYIELYNPDTGERLVGETETGSRKNEVHDVRISPGGDRIWVVLNPGIPVNKTEVLEYAYPSMELIRSIIHDDCLYDGKIVLSSNGEPLLAGRFQCDEKDGDGNGSVRYELLRMLEKGDVYAGEFLELRDDEINKLSSEDKKYGLINGWFIDAVDGSPFLLLSGDYFKSLAYVFDTRDGELYIVSDGYPVGWR